MKIAKPCKKWGISLISAVALIVLSTTTLALEEADLTTSSGLAWDNLIMLVASVLALTLFVLTILAYKRDGRKRLLYVSGAFFLYAVKGFLMASDTFFMKPAWVDPLATLLDFAILVAFFLGILTK